VAAIDIGPLRRHRDYRLLFTGQALSLFGAEVTVVAIPFQAYELTHSTAVVGLLSLVEFVPLMGMAFRRRGALGCVRTGDGWCRSRSSARALPWASSS
jgi:hypothetical protein